MIISSYFSFITCKNTDSERLVVKSLVYISYGILYFVDLIAPNHPKPKPTASSGFIRFVILSAVNIFVTRVYTYLTLEAPPIHSIASIFFISSFPIPLFINASTFYINF